MVQRKQDTLTEKFLDSLIEENRIEEGEDEIKVQTSIESSLRKTREVQRRE